MYVRIRTYHQPARRARFRLQVLSALMGVIVVFGAACVAPEAGTPRIGGVVATAPGRSGETIDLLVTIRDLSTSAVTVARMELWPESKAVLYAWETPNLQAGGDGAYRLSVPRGWNFYVIRVAMSDGREGLSERVSPGPDEDEIPVTVRVSPPRVLIVRVVDSDQAPLKEIRVHAWGAAVDDHNRIWGSHGLTDAQGACPVQLTGVSDLIVRLSHGKQERVVRRRITLDATSRVATIVLRYPDG